MKSIDAVPKSFGVLEKGENVQTAVMRLKRGEASGPLSNEHAESEQVLFVIRGIVDAEIGDRHFRMNPGESTIVPRGVPHRFTGASVEPAVTFNVYGPPAY